MFSLDRAWPYSDDFAGQMCLCVRTRCISCSKSCTRCIKLHWPSESVGCVKRREQYATISHSAQEAEEQRRREEEQRRREEEARMAAIRAEQEARDRAAAQQAAQAAQTRQAAANSSSQQSQQPAAQAAPVMVQVYDVRHCLHSPPRLLIILARCSSRATTQTTT